MLLLCLLQDIFAGSLLIWWNIFYVSICWEFHCANWRTHIFERGRLNHQPAIFMLYNIIYIYIYIYIWSMCVHIYVCIYSIYSLYPQQSSGWSRDRVSGMAASLDSLDWHSAEALAGDVARDGHASSVGFRCFDLGGRLRLFFFLSAIHRYMI